LTFEKEFLEKSKIETHTRIEALQIEKKQLQSNCDNFAKMILNFLEDKTTWTNYLDHKRCPLIKKVLDTILLTKRKLAKIYLLNRRLKMNLASYATIV